MAKISKLFAIVAFTLALAFTVGVIEAAPAYAAPYCDAKAYAPYKPSGSSYTYGYGSVDCNYKPSYIKLWVMQQRYNYEFNEWRTKHVTYNYVRGQSSIGFNDRKRCGNGLWRTRIVVEFIGAPSTGDRTSRASPSRRFGC